MFKTDITFHLSLFKPTFIFYYFISNQHAGRARSERNNDHFKGLAFVANIKITPNLKKKVGDVKLTTSNLCPCVDTSCRWFGNTKNYVKRMEVDEHFDMTTGKINGEADGEIDYSTESILFKDCATTFCQALCRHFIFNLTPKIGLSDDVIKSHLLNMPPCLKYHCKNSNDKKFQKLKKKYYKQAARLEVDITEEDE